MKLTETFNEEMTKQKEMKAKQKEEREKEREAKGPLGYRIVSNVKNLFIGGIYSAIYLAFTYCVVIFITLYLPDVLRFIVNYFDAATVLVINVECACLFFTAWVFIASFIIIKAVTKLYLKGLKKLFHKPE